jgi:hypothetical protein
MWIQFAAGNAVDSPSQALVVNDALIGLIGVWTFTCQIAKMNRSVSFGRSRIEPDYQISLVIVKVIPKQHLLALNGRKNGTRVWFETFENKPGWENRQQS